MRPKHTELVKALFDAWNAHDVEKTVAFYADAYTGQDVAAPRPERNLNDLRRNLTMYWQAFPDIQMTSENIIAQDDQIAVFWLAEGTHLGTVMHIPPSHHTVAVRGVSQLIVQEGKIVYSLRIWDVAGLLRAIKLLPDLL